MTRPTKIVLIVFAALIVGAFAISALGPKMEMSGTTAVTTPRQTQPIPPQTTTGLASGPSVGTPSSLPILADHMPTFQGITKWWNTPDGEPLTPESLKGKVVLVDFWTYSCINCIRTYPFLKSMYAKYKDQGLVIVGVHTPEFAFEADPNNVGREITKNGIEYPVALDPNYDTWNAYNNRYWPAEYFFDRQGHLRRTHFGEGEYDQSEEAIRSLLAEASGVDLSPMGEAVPSPDLSKVQTPETYFGLSRGDAFMGTPGAANSPVDLTAADSVAPNQWTAGGNWTFDPEYIEANAPGNVFRFNVQANTLHIVMDAADGTDKQLEVYVDGVKTKDLTVNVSTLYDIASFSDAGRHTVEIRVKDPGVRFYAATFS